MAREDHTLPRPRPVLDADRRLVGHVAEVGVDADSGVVQELVLDLTPEASERLFGEGMRHGVLRLDAADVGQDGKDALKLARDLGDLRLSWSKHADDEDDLE